MIWIELGYFLFFTVVASLISFRLGKDRGALEQRRLSVFVLSFLTPSERKSLIERMEAEREKQFGNKGKQ